MLRNVSQYKVSRHQVGNDFVYRSKLREINQTRTINKTNNTRAKQGKSSNGNQDTVYTGERKRLTHCNDQKSGLGVKQKKINRRQTETNWHEGFQE